MEDEKPQWWYNTWYNAGLKVYGEPYPEKESVVATWKIDYHGPYVNRQATYDARREQRLEEVDDNVQ